MHTPTYIHPYMYAYIHTYGSIYIFIISANGFFVGGGLNRLSGVEACADLRVRTFHHASDIGLNECIL